MDPVVHFEIPYIDADRISAFYERVFGWKLQKFGGETGDYILATTAEGDAAADQPSGAINGGFYPRKEDWPGQHPSIVIAVVDLGDSLAKVAETGGTVLGDPMEIPNVGRYVAFLDSEGNRCSMLQPAQD